MCLQGPGGKFQWAPSTLDGSEVPSAVTAHDESRTEPVGALTSDMALLVDPEYREIVRQFAEDRELFDHQFAHAWYKLTTRDMGPRSRCANEDAPPEQHWQYPLPRRTSPLPDFAQVKNSLLELLQESEASLGLLVRLAWQCASTFRVTSYLGGCNGARIRWDDEVVLLPNNIPPDCPLALTGQ